MGSTDVLRTFYNSWVSKSSVVTVRETPVSQSTSAKSGGFGVVAESIEAFLEATVTRTNIRAQVQGITG